MTLIISSIFGAIVIFLMASISKRFMHALHSINHSLIMIGENMTAIEQTLQDFVVALDTETTRIANVIQGYLGQLANNTITPEALTAALQPEVDKLKVIGTV
jgi:ABC-type Fe3+-siderophore transport system permease subunit